MYLDDRVQSAASVPMRRTNPEKPDPKSGAVQLEWNLNGTLLMARFGRSQLRSSPTDTVTTYGH